MNIILVKGIYRQIPPKPSQIDLFMTPTAKFKLSIDAQLKIIQNQKPFYGIIFD